MLNAKNSFTPILITILIKATLSFKCPTDNCKISSCLYPDDNDCNSFWHCDNKGVANHKKCPTGLEWNDHAKVCDWPPSPTCGLIPIVSNTPPSTFSTTTLSTTLSTTTTPKTPIPDQDCDCENDNDVVELPLIDLVYFSVEVATLKYGERDLCKIADFVRNYINRYFKTNDWVVLIGSNALFQTPFDYSSSLHYRPGTFVRHLHKYKTSVELFRPKSEEAPNDLVKEPGFESYKLEPRMIHQIETDMSSKRRTRVLSVVNKAFDNNNGVFRNTSEEIFNGISKVCSGEWAVFVARRGLLTQKENFCAAYQRHYGTFFLGTYQRADSPTTTHEVMIFAPSNKQDVSPTSAPTTQRPMPTASVTPPGEFQCPSDDDCLVSMCLHPNRDNCSQFWQCYPDGGKYLHDCPNGLEYNDEFKGCDWPPSPTCHR